jgi:2-iminoacetate synthase ThiH
MYRSKQYSERPWDEVKMEIDMMAKQLPKAKQLPNTTRVFLADGDALNLDAEYIVKIVKYIYEKFPNLERISCYAMPMNLLKKTPEELKKMHDAGLDMLYLGIESGAYESFKEDT